MRSISGRGGTISRCFLSAGEVRRFAEVMRDHRFYLVFVSAVHLAPAIEVIYQFASHSDPCRIIGTGAGDG